MKQKILAVLVLLGLLMGILPTASFSVTEAYAAEAGQQEILVKHLIVPINFTWGQKDKDGNWQYDFGSNGERRSFNGSFDAGWLVDEYKGQLELVGVEPYNGANFDFAGIHDFWYKNDVVTSQDEFLKQYQDRNLTGLSISNFVLNGTVANFTYEGTLDTGRALDIMPTASISGGDAALDTELYPLMGGEADVKVAYPDVYSRLERDFRGKTPDVNESQMYCWFNPMVLTFKIHRADDLAVDQIIVPSARYLPNQAVDMYVNIANYGTQDQSSVVRFDFNGDTQERAVTLKAGEKQKINFAIATPPADGQYQISAEINPDRTTQEVSYDNNRKNAQLMVKAVENQVAPCHKSYTWEEVEIEWATQCDDYGCWTYPIYHYFSYEATLAIPEARATDDRTNLKTYDWLLNNNGTPHNWIRAGYGVKIYATGQVTVEQLSGDWVRECTATVTPPNAASITTDWKMINTRDLCTEQKQTINLGKTGSSHELMQKFMTVPNKVNKAEPPVIYVNLDQADGETSMTLRIQGAYVDGQELCVTKKLPIIIKGDIYDDYRIN